MQRVLLAADGRGTVSAVDIALWSLADLEVRREWRHVDLLLIDATHHLVVAVENKIGSREHSGQLGRYRREVENHFPPTQGWQSVFVFLSPDGDAPSDSAYIPLDYATVCGVVERLAEERKADLEQAVHVLMTHYGRMLRRYVVADAEVVDLCRRIYQRHRAAIDLIVQNRPDTQADLYQFLVELVSSTEGMVLGSTPKQFIRFTLPEWDTAEVRVGTGWGRPSRIFQLEWRNYPDSIFLTLVVAPGPKDVRDKFIAIPGDRSDLGIFGLGGSRHWGHIYNEQVVRKEHFIVDPPDALRDRIRTFWDNFLERTLPLLQEGVTPVVESLRHTNHLGVDLGISGDDVRDRAKDSENSADETEKTGIDRGASDTIPLSPGTPDPICR